MKVLLVDDDRVTIHLLQSVMRKRDWSVTAVSSGELALQELARERYPLVICDLGLPGMPGLDLLKRIRADASLQGTYVIIQTASDESETVQHAFAAGADDYLFKPYDLNTLNVRLFIADRHLKMSAQVKEVEAALGSALRGWHATFDAIGHPIFLVDAEGKIKRCNKALITLLGMEFQKLIGNTPSTIVRPTAEFSLEERLNTVQRTGRRQILLLARDQRWYECTIDPMREGNGKASGTIVVMADVTEQKHADEELRLSEEKFRSIFENAVEGIFQTTRGGEYLSINPTLAKIYGYDSIGDMKEGVKDIARNLYVRPGRREEFIRQMAESGTVVDFESEIYRKDGSIIWISENARSVCDSSGMFLYYEGTVVDVTARHQAEETLRQKNRLQAEMDLARSIQSRLLPEKSPALRGFDLAGRNISASETSGDCFDYLVLPDFRHGLVIADVSGHGLGAAVLMSAARAYVRSQATVQTDCGRILASVNDLLSADLKDGNFLSLCLATLDVDQRTLQYASAGHEPPLLYRAHTGEFVELESTGPLLGIVPGAEFATSPAIQLNTGDVLLMMTDGLFECMNPQEQTLGKEPLKTCIKECAALSAEEILQKLVGQSETWLGGQPAKDDITLVVMKVT